MPQQRVTKKRCKTCRKVKPIREFYIKERRSTATRYMSRCKKCYYRRTYRRDKANGHRGHGSKQKNFAARLMVACAIKLGILKKPKKCSRCGSRVRSRNLHGHHHLGYMKPLRVTWLCRKCHRAVHERQRLRLSA